MTQHIIKTPLQSSVFTLSQVVHLCASHWVHCMVL